MSALTAVRPYVQIARVDHWFKNAFMLLGVVLAIFYAPRLASLVQRAAAGCSLCGHVPHRVEQLRAERAARRTD